MIDFMQKIIVVLIIIISCNVEAQTSTLQLADSLYLNGNYSKSIAEYKKYDNQNEVYSKIARAYIALGNYDEALLNFEAAIKGFPDDALLQYDYAKLLSKTKKYKDASIQFNKLIKVDSLNPNYHYQLGLVLEKTGDSTVHNTFQKVFQLDTTHQKAIFKIAKHHLIKRHHKTVDKYIDIGLQSYVNNKELISLKAQNYYWLEDYHNAIKWFKKLLDLNESSQFIYEKISFCYYRVYDYKNAIIYCNKALQYDPKNPTNLYLLGQMYEGLRDFVNAEKYIALSLKLQDIPLDVEYVKLGSVYNKQKKYRDAIETFKIALKENPKNQKAQFFLATAKVEYYKDYDAKIKVYEDFKKNYPNNMFVRFVDYRLKKLKKEQFLEVENDKEN